MKPNEEIMRIFSMDVRKRLVWAKLDFEKMCAIRIRAGKPVIFEMEDGEYFLGEGNVLSRKMQGTMCLGMEDIQRMLELICNFSLYAFEDEVRQGFVTIQGGHRIGMAGGASVSEGRVDRLKYVTCLNVRIAHEVRGCGDICMPHIFKNGELQNTLIVSECGRGKTTLLRDLVRQISDGSEFHAGMSVGVVDERSEIGASFHGIPQNELGMRTDIMDGCPKAVGVRMLIRSMAPRVIAVDELGGNADLEAVRYGISSGCKLIATCHAADMDGLKGIPFMKRLLGERLISRIVFLKSTGKPGRVQSICDETGGEIFSV